MFGIGGGEMIVILLVALIVLGPDKLPQAAKTAGKVMGDLRKVSSGFQNELRTAMEDADSSSTTTARRNVLRKDDPDAAVTPGPAPDRTAGSPDPVSDAIASVSGNGASSPPHGQERGARRAPAKKAARKATAPRTPTTKATARKATARKASAKKATAKKATATRSATSTAPSGSQKGGEVNGAARPARPRRKAPLTATDSADPRPS